MSKKILLVLILLVGQLFDIQAFEKENSFRETYVYICTGPKSKKYHSTRKCKGLNKCTKDIVEVTKSYAVEIGRTACKICY